MWSELGGNKDVNMLAEYVFWSPIWQALKAFNFGLKIEGIRVPETHILTWFENSKSFIHTLRQTATNQSLKNINCPMCRKTVDCAKTYANCLSIVWQQEGKLTKLLAQRPLIRYAICLLLHWLVWLSVHQKCTSSCG